MFFVLRLKINLTSPWSDWRAIPGVLSSYRAKPDEVRDETMQGVARALPGEKPGALKVIETTVTAEIEDIDKTNEKVTLKFPDGKLQVVKVKDPANLEKVDVGDTIVITMTKQMAISVQKTK